MRGDESQAKATHAESGGHGCDRDHLPGPRPVQVCHRCRGLPRRRRLRRLGYASLCPPSSWGRGLASRDQKLAAQAPLFRVGENVNFLDKRLSSPQ
jgi:hypothetical protein